MSFFLSVIKLKLQRGFGAEPTVGTWAKSLVTESGNSRQSPIKRKAFVLGCPNKGRFFT